MARAAELRGLVKAGARLGVAETREGARAGAVAPALPVVRREMAAHLLLAYLVMGRPLNSQISFLRQLTSNSSSMAPER